MRCILWDTDAFNCARSLGLLTLVEHHPEAAGCFWMTSFIAEHELNQIQADIERLVRCGILTIEGVVARTPAYRRFKKLKSKPGIHKGEAEAIAWAMELPRDQRPLFITNDKAARECARKTGVPAGDLMDFIVELAAAGIADRARLEQCVERWADRSQELCRPRDYQAFDTTFQARQARRPAGI